MPARECADESACEASRGSVQRGRGAVRRAQGRRRAVSVAVVGVRVRQPFMDRDYYSDPRRRFRTAAARALARPLRLAGFELEVRSFYSPIPDLATIDNPVWTEPSQLPGLPRFDLAAELSYIERELGEWIAQFHPPQHATANRFEFYLRNGLFQGGDATFCTRSSAGTGRSALSSSALASLRCYGRGLSG